MLTVLMNNSKRKSSEPWNTCTGTDAEEDREEMDAIQAAWTPEKRNAERLVAELAEKWEAPMLAMSRAGRAFAGLEAVLGGDAFSLQVRMFSILVGLLCDGGLWKLLVLTLIQLRSALWLSKYTLLRAMHCRGACGGARAGQP